MTEAIIAAIAGTAVVTSAIVAGLFGLIQWLIRRPALAAATWPDYAKQLAEDNRQLREEIETVKAQLRWQAQEVTRLNRLVDENFDVSEAALSDLGAKLDHERRLVNRLREYIDILIRQLVDAGIIPAREPGLYDGTNVMDTKMGTPDRIEDGEDDDRA